MAVSTSRAASTGGKSSEMEHPGFTLSCRGAGSAPPDSMTIMSRSMTLPAISVKMYAVPLSTSACRKMPRPASASRPLSPLNRVASITRHISAVLPLISTFRENTMTFILAPLESRSVPLTAPVSPALPSGVIPIPASARVPPRTSDGCTPKRSAAWSFMKRSWPV